MKAPGIKVDGMELDMRNEGHRKKYEEAVGKSIDDALDDLGAVAVFAQYGLETQDVGDHFLLNGINVQVDPMLQRIRWFLDEREADGDISEEAVGAKALQVIEENWQDLVYGHPRAFGGKPTNAEIMGVFGLLMAYEGMRKGEWQLPDWRRFLSSGYTEALAKVVSIREGRKYGVERFGVFKGQFAMQQGECVVFYPVERKAEAMRLARLAFGDVKAFLARKGRSTKYEPFYIDGAADEGSVIAALADIYGVSGAEVSVRFAQN